MNTIVHPVTGEHLSLFSTEGKNLLKQFVKMYQSGGAGEAAAERAKYQIEQDIVKALDEVLQNFGDFEHNIDPRLKILVKERQGENDLDEFKDKMATIDKQEAIDLEELKKKYDEAVEKLKNANERQRQVIDIKIREANLYLNDL